MADDEAAVLRDWMHAALAAAGATDGTEWLEDDAVVALLLDLASDAAHGVTRPAAPLGTFVAGYAAGRAGADLAGLEDVVARIAARAREAAAEPPT